MFSKSGFMILALSCILSIPLLLGETSIVYAGGGKVPPECQDLNFDGVPPDASLKGPALNVTLTLVNNFDGTAVGTLAGKCQGSVFGSLPDDFQVADNVTTFATLTAEDLVGYDFSADIIPDICSTPGSILRITSVNKFTRPFGDTIAASVHIMWWICPTVDHTEPPPPE